MKFIPIALTLALSSLCQNNGADAFVSPSLPSIATVTSLQRNHVTPIQQHKQRQQQFQLYSTDIDELETEIKSMRVGAIKSELESYGISTRTFLEKGELVDALVQARKEGKTPVASSTASTSTASSSSSSSSTSSSSSSSSSSSTASTASTTSSSSSTNSADRQANIQTELEKCKSMKVGELKSELESYGISTKTFFEKSEFVRAVAEARVDGLVAGEKKSKKKKRRAADVEEEVEEVSAKVEVITNDNVGPKTKKTRDAADNSAGSGGGNPFGGAGGSPFGGAAGGANPFGGGGAGGSPFGGGGMGGMDMGGIADMLKGMGGMGGGGGGAPGGNPFGGAGGNPFGGAGGADPMKAAQAAMSNPKVMAVIAKAQKNPKVMQAVQECMGNPMAMGKYMSDPEVGPILKELQDAMK